MTKKTIQLNGMNRGGNAHLQELLRLAPDGVRESEVQIVDPEPGRALERATDLRSQGITTSHVEDRAPRESNATYCATFIDDAPATAAIWEGTTLPNLHQTALLLSDGHAGRGLGFSNAIVAASGPGMTAARSGTQKLLDRVADGAGERTTSREMTDWAANADPTERARAVTHASTASRTAAFLEGVPVQDCIELIDGASGNNYDIRVEEVQPDARRTDLRRAVVHDILVEDTDDRERRGVAFIDRVDPVMFFVLAVRRRDRWVLERMFELPPRQFSTPTMPIFSPADVRGGVLQREARARSSRRRSLLSEVKNTARILVTD
ncbi:MAG: hypothetical protein NXI30_19290 [bacterium]|nr:hypothetical protein [bacterium]